MAQQVAAAYQNAKATDQQANVFDLVSSLYRTPNTQHRPLVDTTDIILALASMGIVSNRELDEHFAELQRQRDTQSKTSIFRLPRPGRDDEGR